MPGIPLVLQPSLCGVPYPAHLEWFMTKVAELVCDVFEDCGKNFQWISSGHPKFAVLVGHLNEWHHVKMSITDGLSVVVFYIPGNPIKELSRMTLRNDSWTDFVGWLSQVKTRYDEILAQ